MSGQTIGPLGEVAEHDQLAKEIVESVDCLTVRDSLYSRRYLEIIGAHPQEFIETIDDAYTLPYQDEKLPADTASFVEDGNCVALNITQYTSDTTEQRNFVARLGEQIITQFDTKLVLVSHTPLDFGRLWMIYDSIPNALKHRVWLPDTRQWRDAMLKKLISHCRLAIGGRYHFIVFAGTSNTPFVGMAGNHYSYIKQDGFARPLGLGEFDPHRARDLGFRLCDGSHQTKPRRQAGIARQVSSPVCLDAAFRQVAPREVWSASRH